MSAGPLKFAKSRELLEARLDKTKNASQLKIAPFMRGLKIVSFKKGYKEATMVFVSN